MEEKTKHIKFHNRQNPTAQFDLIELHELFRRDDLEHAPEKLHRVEFYMIIFIEKGHGQHTIDFTDYNCSPGTLLTVRKDQIHKFFRGTDLKGTMLLFTNEFLVSYLEELEAQKTLLLFNELLGTPKLQLNNLEFKGLQQVIERIHREYFEVNDQHSLSIIRSELHILIANLFRIKAQRTLIDFDKKYLREFIELQELVELNAVKITKVKDYAHMLGLSTKTLNTITNRIVHKSAKDFIDEIRTKQIKRLLINTTNSIKEVAYQAGFEETTNFYKYFKRQTLTTPEQFRTSHS